MSIIQRSCCQRERPQPPHYGRRAEIGTGRIQLPMKAAPSRPHAWRAELQRAHLRQPHRRRGRGLLATLLPPRWGLQRL